ncbi:MAG TPA: helix-turn-helix transcriptional regulator [Mycobacteriales bacterium]|nr:helix-turn-helix transcriptional regulator [Mycobacteriales bacterium]
MSQVPRTLTPGRSARDLFGAELRHWRCLRALSQADLADLTHFSSDLISKVEKAERWPQWEFTEACDTALDTGEELARIWPWVETERGYQAAHVDRARLDADTTGTWPGWPGSPGFISAVLPHTGRNVGAGSRGRGRAGRPAAPARGGGVPLTLEELLTMTAHESAWYFDHPSNVGPATLDQLRSEVTRLARSFANVPRLQVFANARWLRDQAFGLLDGRQQMSESRDLYFMAGATCGMLANITSDFGFYDAAMAHARTAWLCAQQADHNGLRAWILGRQSLIAYNDGRFGHAAIYARRGQEHASPGTVGVSLAALEARATSRLGDVTATRAALVRAGENRGRVASDELDEIGGIMGFSRPKQHHYDAESHLGIGDAASVIAEAESCVTGYREGPDDDRAYDNMASAQVNRATAHALDNDLEAARAAAQPAFDLPPELRPDALRQRFRRLHRHLTDPAVSTAQPAVELRDQIEHFLGAPSHPLPPSP